MTPLRALYLALAICHTAQARLSRSRSRVHHSTIQDRENASADVRTGRFLATYLEPVIGGLEWVPRPARRA